MLGSLFSVSSLMLSTLLMASLLYLHGGWRKAPVMAFDGTAEALAASTGEGAPPPRD